MMTFKSWCIQNVVRHWLCPERVTWSVGVLSGNPTIEKNCSFTTILSADTTFLLWQTQSILAYWNVIIACLFGPDPYLIFSLSALKLMIKGIIQLWWLLLPHVHVWLLSRQQEIFTHRKFGKVRYLVSAIQDVRMEDCEPQSALLLVIQVSSVSLHTVLCSAFFPYPIRRNLMWHDCGSISLQQL